MQAWGGFEGSVKKIEGEMLTESYKIHSLINFRILNEPKAAVAVAGLFVGGPIFSGRAARSRGQRSYESN